MEFSTRLLPVCKCLVQGTCCVRKFNVSRPSHRCCTDPYSWIVMVFRSMSNGTKYTLRNRDFRRPVHSGGCWVSLDAVEEAVSERCTHGATRFKSSYWLIPCSCHQCWMAIIRRNRLWPQGFGCFPPWSSKWRYCDSIAAPSFCVEDPKSRFLSTGSSGTEVGMYYALLVLLSVTKGEKLI